MASSDNSPSLQPLNATSGACPVKKSGDFDVTKERPKSACPMKSGETPAPSPSGWRSLFLKRAEAADVGVPASVEEAARYSQDPQPDQRVPLSTARMISSIPRADELRPEAKHATHQQPDSSHWVYPSEQQFYNAMRRKGYKLEDMAEPAPDSPLAVVPYIVRIHNAVNERCWMEICRWERDLHSNQQPRLIRFMGRPNDLSPKAWFNSRILFKKEPFDRHDWFIDRGDGYGERRYVIDFYNGHDQDLAGVTETTMPSDYWTLFLKTFSSSSSTNTTLPPSTSLQTFQNSRPSMYVDVRPALDSPDAFYDRTRMFFRDAFPGIARWTSSSPDIHSSSRNEDIPSSSSNPNQGGQGKSL